jgi:hypothetical protein
VITTDTFRGLGRLERLRLSSNRLVTLESGAFSHLGSIQKVDLVDNPLSCDCHLAWLLEHLNVAGARARCAEPPALRGLFLRKLAAADMTCGSLAHQQRPARSHLGLRLQPARSQAVFEGDSLRLRCSAARVPNQLLLRWFHNARPVSPELGAAVSSQPAHTPAPAAGQEGPHTQLDLATLTMDHSGNWTCSALMDTGEVQNITLSVVVIHHATVLCPSTTTNTTRGVHRWGVALAGTTARQACQRTIAEELVPGVTSVEYRCDQTGQWGRLDDSQCAHTSNVTEMLYSFAYMNKSDFDQNSFVLVESARQLLKFTNDSPNFRDGMDIVYLSSVLENYVPYLSTNHELAGLMVDIAANVMRMAPHIVEQGQLFGHAATRLVATIANISRAVPNFRHHRAEVALQGIQVSPRSFAGVTCSWYSRAGSGSERLLHCSDSNKTVASAGRTMLGSVRLPATLYHQLTMLDRDVATATNIAFTAFENSSLFPQVSSSDMIKSYSECPGVHQ